MMAETFGASRMGATFQRRGFCSDEPEEPERTRPACDLVVVQPLNREWKCHRCGKTGDLLMMENPGPACLICVGLNDLEFLPAGDAPLSCASAERAAATNDKACWSSLWPWRTRLDF